MKYIISVLTFSLIFLVLISPLLSQSLVSNVGVNFGAGVPLGDSQFKRTNASPEMNFYWSYNYLENVDLKFLFGYGKSVHNIPKNFVGNSVLSGEILGVYSFSGVNPLLPFFQFGFGVESIINETVSPRTDGIIIGGCGLKIPYRADFNFLISANLRYPFGEFYPDFFSKFSKVKFCFKTGIQVDLNSLTKSNRTREFERSNFLANNRTTQSDSSIFDRLQLQQLLVQNINLRNEILTELEELIGVQNKMIETLDVQLTNIIERKQVKIIVANFQKEKMENRNFQNQQPKPAISFSQVKILYENALNAYNSKDYRSSILILTNCKENFPYHQLFGNFVYWIGESYFGLKNYKLAIQSFEEVQKYGNSLKKDDAMLMIGVCYYRIGDFSKANRIFQNIIKEFPDSEYKNKSREYLALLARKIIS
jgi:TolA-binding protein